MNKLIILFLIVTTLLSCGSIELTTKTQSDYDYELIQYRYDYNLIHNLYLHNPRFFYGGIYIDAYGRQRYMYSHPYYIRYVKEKQRRGNTHIQRSNNNTTVRRTTSHNNNRTAVVNNNRTNRNTTVRPTTRNTSRTVRPTTTIRRNNSTTIRRNNSQAIKRSAPTRTVIKRSVPTRTKTSSVKRRN